MSRIDKDLPAEVTKYQTRFLASIAAIVGFSLMTWGSSFPTEQTFWGTLITNVGAVIVTTALLSFLWDVGGRRNLTREVLSIVGLKQDISHAGLTQATVEISEIKMQEYITKSKNIELFLAYGSTWLGNNEAVIRKFARQRGRSLTVIFPDPEDQITVSALAQRFRIDEITITKSILDSTKRLHELSAPGKAKIIVRFYKGQPTHSFYRFDDTFIAVLYHHQQSRTKPPVLVARGGTFSEFIGADLSSLKSNSKEVGPDDVARIQAGKIASPTSFVTND